MVSANRQLCYDLSNYIIDGFKVNGLELLNYISL